MEALKPKNDIIGHNPIGKLEVSITLPKRPAMQACMDTSSFNLRNIGDEVDISEEISKMNETLGNGSKVNTYAIKVGEALNNGTQTLSSYLDDPRDLAANQLGSGQQEQQMKNLEEFQKDALLLEQQFSGLEYYEVRQPPRPAAEPILKGKASNRPASVFALQKRARKFTQQDTKLMSSLSIQQTRIPSKNGQERVSEKIKHSRQNSKVTYQAGDVLSTPKFIA